MEYKILFGSKMLKLNNPRDEDWLVLTSKKHSNELLPGERRQNFYGQLIDLFLKGRPYLNERYRALFLYQLSSGFHLEEYPFSAFNILKHKAIWISHLKAYVNSTKVEEEAFSEKQLPKVFYHLLYQYYMIVENTHWISEEAKARVQKIHDLETPSEHFYDIKLLINSLETEEVNK